MFPSGKSIEIESSLVVVWNWRAGAVRSQLLIGTGFIFWGDENVLKLGHRDGCTTL